MISNKDELKRYLALDKKVYGITRRFPPIYGACHWKFLYALRHEEYHASQPGLYHRIAKKFWAMLHSHYGIKMGWDIPINTFGPGLKINHFGLIVVNANARIGAFCDIHQGVNIGQHGTEQDDVPTIGDNVWIGPGAKIFGRITIASRCAIGANAVVNKSFTEENISIAGIPAKKISETGNPYIKTEDGI
jgi:serine O-acetyltransferase